MTYELDLSARREKSLKSIQCILTSVSEIVEEYSHVAVYEFDALMSKWERLDVEGTAFITLSASLSMYSLIVLNKKGGCA